MRSTTYGLGGYDPSKPNNNIIEDIEINLPDPRDQATTEFATYYGRIRAALGAD